MEQTAEATVPLGMLQGLVPLGIALEKQSLL